MPVRALTCDRLRRLLEGRIPPRVLDVRTPAEYERYHLPGAVNIPLGDLDMRAGELDPLVDLVVVSENGVSSVRACAWLEKRGFYKVANLLGGMSEFRAGS